MDYRRRVPPTVDGPEEGRDRQAARISVALGCYYLLSLLSHPLVPRRMTILHARLEHVRHIACGTAILMRTEVL